MGLENTELGGYLLISRIGRGGMAEVWLANQTALNREVAVKLLPANIGTEDALDLAKRFEREAYSIARLDHPAILPVIDYGKTPNFLYLIMPVVRGGSLQEQLKQRMLTRAQAFTIFGQILSALNYAHRQQIIHRDLKPGNILLHQDGRAVLADFGIAKALNENVGLTQTGYAVGSPEYMAPEQFLGLAEYRSDLYSMGVILYQLLTGGTLYSGTSAFEIAMRHTNDPLPLPHPLVPPSIEQFLTRALQKRPEARFANAAEMEAAFQRAVSQLSPAELSVRPVPSKEDPTRFVAPGSGSYPNEREVATTVLPSPLAAGNSSPVLTSTFTPAHASSTSAYTSVLNNNPVAANLNNNPSVAVSQPVAVPSVTQNPATIQKKVALPLPLIGGLAVLLVILVVGAKVLIAGSGSGSKPQPTVTAVAAVGSGSGAGSLASLTVTFGSQNGSKVGGKGVLTDNGDGTTTVVLSLTGLEAGPHLAHIHVGTCLNQGAIKFPLNSFQTGSDGTGSSTTKVAATFAALTAGNFYLAVHNQSSAGTPVVGCGDIVS